MYTPSSSLMPTTIRLLSHSQIYLLRAVLASCVICLLLFIPGPQIFNLDSFPLPIWLSLGLFLFILVHHLLMSFNKDLFHGLANFPPLLLEITGLGFYIHFLIALYPQYAGWHNWSFNNAWQILPSSIVCLVVCCLLLVFLSLELVLRIGLLIAVCITGSRQISSADRTSQEKIKPYQVIFGHSSSRIYFNELEHTRTMLSAEYYTSDSHMKFVLFWRRFLLRVILISCLVSLALIPSIWFWLANADYLWIALLPIIMFHHLLSCINVEFHYIFADLPFLVFEITSIAYYFRNVVWFDRWSSSALIGYCFFAYVIFICLVLEALIWVGSLILYIARRLMGSGSVDLMGQEIPKPQNVLFGNSLWKTHLPGETRIIKVPRGLIAIGLILVVVFFSVVNIILDPIHEVGLTPTNNFRSLAIPQYLQADTAVWNVVFTTPYYHRRYTDRDWNSVFQAAVNVTPLWDNSYDLNPSCAHVPEATYHMSHLKVNTVHCQPRPIPIDSWQPGIIFPLARRDSTPDLLITVNFTTLQIPVDTIINMFNNSVQIMIGFTNDTHTVVNRTLATTLMPGTNLVGSFTWQLRQLLKSPRLSAFTSLFDSYETFALSQTLGVYPDPLVSVNPLILHSPNTSTFRVSLQNDLSEFITVQDYTNQSVLRGFAEVGGLWTFLGGVFAVIFGKSLLRILFGTKSISFFGLAHSIQHKKIQEACRQEYPQIVNQIHSDHGLLSFLSNQLIDVEFLEDVTTHTEQPAMK